MSLFHFSFLGLDFNDVSSMASALEGEEDIARRCQIMYKHIKSYQASFTAIEKVRGLRLFNVRCQQE